MAEFKVKDKETGEIFTIREKEPTQETTQPAQETSQQGILQQLMSRIQQPSLSGPLGSVMGLDKAVGDLVGGAIRPPTQIIGRAGQQIESMMSGQPPQNYSIPLPEYMGGNIDIQPAQNIGQAMLPVAETTLTLLGIKSAMNPRAITKVMKYDNALKQAQKAKVALDETRSILGQAKDIAMQEVKDLPVNFDWKDIPQKALNILKNPDSKVLFDSEGKIVNTMANLDRVKVLLQDMPSQKDFVEAGKLATGDVIRYAGKVRDAMVSTANEAGKPQLAKALRDYHTFMNNYNPINDHLVDKYGNAMANKLKATFRIFAEPAIKENWKEIAKSNPEIKSIMNSRTNRELLKNLLKVGVAGTAIGAGKGALHLLAK